MHSFILELRGSINKPMLPRKKHKLQESSNREQIRGKEKRRSINAELKKEM